MALRRPGPAVSSEDRFIQNMLRESRTVTGLVQVLEQGLTLDATTNAKTLRVSHLRIRSMLSVLCIEHDEGKDEDNDTWKVERDPSGLAAHAKKYGLFDFVQRMRAAHEWDPALAASLYEIVFAYSLSLTSHLQYARHKFPYGTAKTD